MLFKTINKKSIKVMKKTKLQLIFLLHLGLYIGLALFFVFERSLAICKSSELKIANATYKTDTFLSQGESLKINCNAGYYSPDRKTSFDVLCKNSSSYYDPNGNKITQDSWFLVPAQSYVCVKIGQKPSSSATVNQSCDSKSLNLTNATASFTKSKIPSGGYIEISCNPGYAASGISVIKSQVDLSSYNPLTKFKIYCKNGVFEDYTPCLSTCDVSELRSKLKPSQILNTTASIVAPDDHITVTCSSGGIPQTGLISYDVYCTIDTENCSDINDTKCVTKTFFTVKQLTAETKIVNKFVSKTSGVVVDSQLLDLPSCSPYYLPCDNKQILDVVGLSKVEETAALQGSERTMHGSGIKVTCYNSSGLIVKNRENLDSDGKNYRIFTCSHGSWSPNPSELICPDRNCEDNESCGYGEQY